MFQNTGTVSSVTEPQVLAQSKDEARPESLIDKHSSFNGLYRSTHNLRIQGAVDGEIDCQSTLTIDKEAKVRAKVVAQNVTVGGSLEGEVNCPGRFEILPTGRVIGKVVAGMLEIHAGAFYQGDLSMQNQSDLPLKGIGPSGSRGRTSASDLAALFSDTAVPTADKAAGTKPLREGKAS